MYVQYEYDLLGEVTAIRENGNVTDAALLALYTYDDLGRRTNILRGGTTTGASLATTSYAYNAASSVATLVQNPAGSTYDQTFTLSYNPSGQSTSRASSNSLYDWPQPSLGYANYAPNGLNQYSTVAGSNLTYDGRGNLTSDGTTSYAYNIYNLLTNAGTAAYSYDPAQRLYETTVSGTTTRMLYDGAQRIAEYNTSGTMLRRYVPGPGLTSPVVWYEGSGVTDRRWLLTDQLGSPIAITDTAGAVTAVNSYDEFGRPGASNSGKFQFAGQIWLPEASTYHFAAREYSPGLGRFLQSDPILYAGGPNLYAYVGNDPLNRFDPLGFRDYDMCTWRPEGTVHETPDGQVFLHTITRICVGLTGQAPETEGAGGGVVQGVEDSGENEEIVIDASHEHTCSVLAAQLARAAAWRSATGQIHAVGGFAENAYEGPGSMPDPVLEGVQRPEPPNIASLGRRLNGAEAAIRGFGFLGHELDQSAEPANNATTSALQRAAERYAAAGCNNSSEGSGG